MATLRLEIVTPESRAYSDDVDMPGQAYACMVRSPHAHARIRAIDTAGARALPGVLADRRRVQAGRRVDSDTLVRWMEPRWLAAKRREKAFTASRRS